MFEKGLEISGGPFESSITKEFELLKDIKGISKKNMYSSLIYGRNGSGKTTICNALDEVNLTEVERTLNVSLVDTNDLMIMNIPMSQIISLFIAKNLLIIT